MFLFIYLCRGLEQDFRDKLTALRSESEYESEVLLEQVENERERLREELELLQAQDVSLQEDICTAAKVVTVIVVVVVIIISSILLGCCI